MARQRRAGRRSENSETCPKPALRTGLGHERIVADAGHRMDLRPRSVAVVGDEDSAHVFCHLSNASSSTGWFGWGPVLRVRGRWREVGALQLILHVPQKRVVHWLVEACNETHRVRVFARLSSFLLLALGLRLLLSCSWHAAAWKCSVCRLGFGVVRFCFLCSGVALLRLSPLFALIPTVRIQASQSQKEKCQFAKFVILVFFPRRPILPTIARAASRWRTVTSLFRTGLTLPVLSETQHFPPHPISFSRAPNRPERHKPHTTGDQGCHDESYQVNSRSEKKKWVKEELRFSYSVNKSLRYLRKNTCT